MLIQPNTSPLVKLVLVILGAFLLLGFLLSQLFTTRPEINARIAATQTSVAIGVPATILAVQATSQPLQEMATQQANLAAAHWAQLQVSQTMLALRIQSTATYVSEQQLSFRQQVSATGTQLAAHAVLLRDEAENLNRQASLVRAMTTVVGLSTAAGLLICALATARGLAAKDPSGGERRRTQRRR